MNSSQLRVMIFNSLANVPMAISPHCMAELPSLATMRYRLIAEELEELKIALANNDIVEVADALGDLLYVVYGAGCCFGIDLEPIFDEIHRSNMTKRQPDGSFIMQKDGPLIGKILKPSTYRPPNLVSILKAQGLQHFGKGPGE